MPELTNSKRFIETATYVHIQRDPIEDADASKNILRGPEKVNFIIQVSPTNNDLERIRSNLNNNDAVRMEPAIVAIAELIGDESSVRTIRHSPKFAHIEADTLVDFGGLLVESRRQAISDTAAILRELKEEFLAEQPGQTVQDGSVDRVLTNAAGTLVDTSNTAPGPQTMRVYKIGRLFGESEITDVLAWAEESDDSRFPQLMESTADFPDDLPLAEWSNAVDDQVNAFVERMKIEPVGRLHLERIEMTPIGIERGELVYSVPLAPKETIQISHKEWSVQSEEFDQIVQDYLEDFSENGVTEKLDLSQSTESEHKKNTKLSLSVRYSGYGVSAAVGYKSDVSDSRARKDSINRNLSATRKASARSRKEHKHSFKVTSVSGIEEQSARVISNPSESETMRIDYYQMMRKWRTDLFRYDLRMTYDIVIPTPGLELLRKLEEIAVLDDLIDSPFEFATSLDEIDEDSWADLAATYGAAVETPPEDTTELSGHKILRREEDLDNAIYDAIVIDIDEAYEVESVDFRADLDIVSGGAPRFHVPGDSVPPLGELDSPAVSPLVRVDTTYISDLTFLKGLTGRIAIVFWWQNSRNGAVQIMMSLKLKDSIREAWRLATWNALREAAEEAYFTSRQTLIERRKQLLAEIAQFDALTLRKMEREELMKGVLRWLFGPEFELFPAEIENSLTGREQYLHSNGTTDRKIDRIEPSSIQRWESMIRYGELVKFLHHAIEWENMLYFTYPYFWDTSRNRDFKRFLQHPDPLHREFIRAGSARVVLTIRPGFEESFTRLVETGVFGDVVELADDHPYLTIAQEIRSYATANYKGIASANPEELDEASVDIESQEQVAHIGQWFEYTPTSALDISINTSLPELA